MIVAVNDSTVWGRRAFRSFALVAASSACVIIKRLEPDPQKNGSNANHDREQSFGLTPLDASLTFGCLELGQLSTVVFCCCVITHTRTPN